MYGHGKSDRPVVPGKPPNKAQRRRRAEEAVEERGLAKGNPNQPPRHRAQDRTEPKEALERIRQAATRDRRLRFTSLWHHVYDKKRLRAAFGALKPKAAPGVAH